MKLISVIKRLTHLEKLKRKFLIEKQSPPLLRVINLQEKLLQTLRFQIHRPVDSLTSAPHEALPRSSSDNLSSPKRQPPETFRETSAKTSAFVSKFSEPQLKQIRTAITDWHHEQEINSNLLADLKTLTEKFFYTEHDSYNSEGKKSYAPLKRYSHST